MNIGDKKGQFLDESLEKYKPTSVLEMGCYCGYSGMRTLRKLSKNGFLISLELSPDNAKIARQMFEYAGVSDRVEIVIGDCKETIPTLKQKLKSFRGVEHFDMVFIDHSKENYLRDLLLVENHDLIRSGSVVVADNVVVFKIQSYLDHVRDKSFYSSSELKLSTLEYVTEHDEQVQDGVEISIKK